MTGQHHPKDESPGLNKKEVSRVAAVLSRLPHCGPSMIKLPRVPADMPSPS